MLSCHSSTLAYFVSDWTADHFGNLNLNRRTIRDLDIKEISHYQGTSEDFLGLQQCWFPEYYEMALEERVEVAADLVRINNWRPALFRLALSRNCIPNRAVHVRDSGGQTLLHIIARVIGSIAAESVNGKGSRRNASALEGMSRNSTIVIHKYL